MAETIIAKAVEAALDELERQGEDEDGPYVLREASIIDGAVDLPKLIGAILTAIRTPSEAMVKAGEAWRAHCSDTDSLFEEMIDVAIHGPK